MQYLNWGFRFHFLTSRGKKLFLAPRDIVLQLIMICFQSVLGKHVKLFFLLFSRESERKVARENKEAFPFPAGFRVIRSRRKKKDSVKREIRIYPLDGDISESYLISTSFPRLIHFGLWWCSCIEYISLVHRLTTPHPRQMVTEMLISLQSSSRNRKNNA